ncbi:uncharacterized protein L201_001591 [Kwoniella dendrophila CBS 6074]|uniref:N-acetyltransferase domain-containing protein n=1 Tax=Kwoniella dendrophila CBS 6074 TaxID=1295534 RepID=A0AAX4JQG3_9TREE
MSSEGTIRKLEKPTVEEREEILDFLSRNLMDIPLFERQYGESKVAQRAYFLSVLGSEYDPEQDNSDSPRICNVWTYRNTGNGDKVSQSVLAHAECKEMSEYMVAIFDVQPYIKDLWSSLSNKTSEWIKNVPNEAFKQVERELPDHLQVSAADSIKLLATASSARRKGYGKQLMSKVIESKDWESDNLTVLTSTEEGVKFYKSCGFTVAKQVPITISEGKTATITSLYIDDDKKRTFQSANEL